MARRTKITITTASNLVVVQDYETVTGQIYQMKAGGFGEYTMAQYANVDLTNSESMIALIHSDGTTFQAVAIESIESVTINGVDATITNLSLVRDAVAPYFFNVGGGGFAFYTEINISSSQILNNFATGGNSGGFELLPAIAGCYYDFVADWEYTRGTVSYSTAASAIQFNYYNAGLNTSTSLAVISGLNLSFSGNRCCPNIRPQMQSTAFNSFNIGDSLCIKLANNINPTLGNGTVKIKLRYNIIRFS